ncbi:glycosyl hydrolase 115 family protein [Cohnella suwonensis]|uniref:Glycosyl hydrolase 115 family protein n=1 Tax=Cohnella suwonensis TaxID=696072 RepID=A0ABW0LVR6_9BACL
MLELFKKNHTVTIYVSEKETRAVQIAVENLLRDIGWTCGCKAVLSKEMDKCSIIIGTIDNEEIEEMTSNKRLSLDKLRMEDGSFHWEAFLQEVVDGVFYIIGTNRRGTIFGIYDLCEAMGMSPWYYWADVPVKTKNAFRIPLNFSKADWPSVKYRGIFLNDEEELDDWAKLHTSDGTIGPETYRRIFELLLRLKANYIWPAMHVNYFNGNPENGKLAEEMGVVVGTSHCDMLLRSNQNEWIPWTTSKGYTDAVYDYSIEGRNRDILKEYWRESVEQNRNYEVCYSMGMRGIHDSGFQTQTIDEDPSMNEEEKIEAKVSLLSEVIKDQRQILIDVLGENNGQEALKTFIPYKEVLALYDRGLDLPDDMTLIWANDNFGYMRRYPNEAERGRRGGHGLYYHCSYWAHPGTGMSYLFIGSTPLAHIGNELRKSYESGIRKVWVLNVGGLKPLEQDMEFFLRYGWEAGKETGITKDALQFTEHWINSNFSGNHGAEAAKLYEAFAQATNVRKIEHMTSHVFSQTVYGDEAGRRLMRLENIFRRGNAILNSLPDEERPAFFQLFLMKIHASYYTNLEYYYADRSTLVYDRGNMQAADRYVEYSKRVTNYKRRMLYFYNKKMSDGKWDLILTPESYPPPPTAMYPAGKPALRIGGSGMKVSLWNEEETLSFSIYGQRQKWLEIRNQGTGSIPFTIEVKEGADWIVLSEKDGTVQTEKRILVSVIDPEKHSGKEGLLTVHDHKDGTVIPIRVQVEEAMPIPEGLSGYAESDGYVSISAAEYNRNIYRDGQQTGAGSCGWVTVPGIGRYEGAAVMAWHSELVSIDGKLADNPYLEYGLYLKQGGKFQLEIYRYLTLNSTGRIRFGIGIDDNEPVMMESDIRDEWLGQWQECVVDNGEKMTVELPCLSAGAHCLKLYMVDHYVTITKLVLYTSPRRLSNIGPMTSWHNHRPVAEHGTESPDVDWHELEQLCNELYRTNEDEVPPPSVLFATSDSSKMYDPIFLEERPQMALGEKRYANLCNSRGEKDVLREFGSGVFIESGGIVAIEAEYALENSSNAYLTPSNDGSNKSWSHLQAETNGRTGFAMHVAEPGILWENPENAPGMHYRMNIRTPGEYHVWLLVRHYNSKSDSCYLSVDGVATPLSKLLGKGDLNTYNTAQAYYWCLISDMELTTGEHVFSILARKSQLRVDRIYLTVGNELPPMDAQWQDSARE